LKKSAQAIVLMSHNVPALVKLALALYHTRLNKPQRVKLASQVLNKFPQQEKTAMFKLLSKKHK
jgi:hypothetical protein